VTIRKEKAFRLTFDDNDLLSLLCGQYNVNLAKIEKTLNVSIDSFGNELRIKGFAEQTELAGDVIQRFFKQLSADPDPQAAADGPLIEDILRLVLILLLVLVSLVSLQQEMLLTQFIDKP